MTFIHACKDFLAGLLAINEDQDATKTAPSLLCDYSGLIEAQESNDSDKTASTDFQKVLTKNTPIKKTSQELYYPASFDGLKRQLATIHQENQALEEEVSKLKNEIISIRERAKRLGAALFETALS